jgi:hypothetical protein
MNISTVTETSHRAPATPVPPAASTAGASATTQAPGPEVPKTPAPPAIGLNQDVLVGVDEATNRKVYDIVALESGESIQQIPAEAVLNLVANILQQLEAEGLR